MLLSRATCERKEDMRIVFSTLGNRPVFHRSSDDISSACIECCTSLNGLLDGFVDGLGQNLFHLCQVENIGCPDVSNRASRLYIDWLTKVDLIDCLFAFDSAHGVPFRVDGLLCKSLEMYANFIPMSTSRIAFLFLEKRLFFGARSRMGYIFVKIIVSHAQN